MNSTFKASKATPPPPGRFSGGACRAVRYGNVHGGCAGKFGKKGACGKDLKIRGLRKVATACTGGVR